MKTLCTIGRLGRSGDVNAARSGVARLAVLALLGLAVAGCSEREDVLPGKRIDVRVPLSKSTEFISGPEDDGVVDLVFEADGNQLRPLAIPAPRSLNSWTHVNGTMGSRVGNLALPSRISQLWSVSIGKGSDRRQRLTATPVFAGGLIFTMDAQSRVTALTTDGKTVWSRSLVPVGEGAGDASSGGLAYSDGILFATTGFGELHAMNAVSGDRFWVQKFDAPATLAPAASGELVYVVTQDSRAWAIDRTNGRLRWRWESAEADANITSGAAPAVAGEVVVLPYPSGTIQAVNPNTGLEVWSTKIGGSRGAAARSSLTAVSGGPVIDGDTIYAANQAGTMSAVDLGNGQAKWTVREGSYSPVWPVGDSIFLVSDAAELVRLDAESGERIWSAPLPEFKRQRLTRRKAVFANYGPVLAGGRLIVASSDGMIRQFDPTTGGLLGSAPLAGGAASSPIIVNGVLYVVSQQGNLVAFR